MPKKKTPARTQRRRSAARSTRARARSRRPQSRRRPRQLRGGEKICAICRDSIEAPQDGEIIQLRCRHLFHSDCLFNDKRDKRDKRNLRTDTCPECRAPIDPEDPKDVKVVEAPPPDAEADAAEKLIADLATAAEVDAAASKKRRRDEEVGAGAGAEDASVRAERLAQRRRLDETFLDERIRLSNRLSLHARFRRFTDEFRQMPDTRPPYSEQWRNEVYYQRRFNNDLFFNNGSDPDWAIYDAETNTYRIYYLYPGENDVWHDPAEYDRYFRQLEENGRESLFYVGPPAFHSRRQWELANAYIDRLLPRTIDGPTTRFGFGNTIEDRPGTAVDITHLVQRRVRPGTAVDITHLVQRRVRPEPQ